MKNLEKKTTEKPSDKISASVRSAISFCRAIQDISKENTRVVGFKEIKCQSKTKWLLHLIDDHSHRCSITLFPIGDGAFEGRFRCKGEIIDFVTSSTQTETN